jgi:hypothetical protein
VVLQPAGPDGFPGLSARLWLQPFDQGLSQHFAIAARPSRIPEVVTIHITMARLSGPTTAWRRSYTVFLEQLRAQFLLWRTLDDDARELYLAEAEHLGHADTPTVAAATAAADAQPAAPRLAGWLYLPAALLVAAFALGPAHLATFLFHWAREGDAAYALSALFVRSVEYGFLWVIGLRFLRCAAGAPAHLGWLLAAHAASSLLLFGLGLSLDLAPWPRLLVGTNLILALPALLIWLACLARSTRLPATFTQPATAT